MPPDFFGEFDEEPTIRALEEALASLGYAVDRIGNFDALLRRVAAGDRWDLVFNIAEGLGGRSREAHVPALLEAVGVPYTGSDPLTLALTLDKDFTKRVWRAHDLPTAPWFVAASPNDLGPELPVEFPLFVKPLHEGSSKGIDESAVVRDVASAAARVEHVQRVYGQPALLERFLPGPDYGVGIVGTGREAFALGAVRYLTTAPDAVRTFHEKEHHKALGRLSEPVEDASLRAHLEDLALRAYHAVDARDLGRVDLRADEHGAPQLLEINSLPNLDARHSGMVLMARERGMTYRDLLQLVVDSAHRRACISPHGALPARKGTR
ncbi:D-alanine--D-alanine ligase family protein [Deinococcus yavapaiensis]|uniref:D-alanine--D-alanine ligase family protein n=1 Tax=Deinococcus yavapaiensis TaxID=309889 RepID=UPI001474B43D|nr:D-alanine--D-alanine ligase [Deinococcus yavapaiensis]